MRDLDYAKVQKKIEKWIGKKVESASAKGVVVGLSGGIDSSVTVTLCVNALGKENVLGVLMPESFTPEEDMIDAETLANSLGIKYRLNPIHSLVSTFSNQIVNPDWKGSMKIPFANLRARFRMAILYFYANKMNYLVVGTGDKSEDMIGYFTKYGDGGVDILPLADLYKTEVIWLGEYLGVPKKIIMKPSSPQLYEGHLATQELPADYPMIDKMLWTLTSGDVGTVESAKEFSYEEKRVARKLTDMITTSQHKREYPPICLLSDK